MRFLNLCGAFLLFLGVLAAAPYLLLLLQALPPTKVLLVPFGIAAFGGVLFFSTRQRLKVREGRHGFEMQQRESARA